MNATLLEQALRELGVEARVETDGALAVLLLRRDDARLPDAAFRRSLVAAAAGHGFRNLALELD